MTTTLTKQKRSSRFNAMVYMSLFLLMWLVCGAIAFYERDIISSWYTRYTEGEPASKDIYSPYSFTFVNTPETEAKRQFEREQVDEVFVIDVTIGKKVFEKIDALFEASKKFATNPTTVIQAMDAGAFFALDRAHLKTIALSDDTPVLKARITDLLTRYFTDGIMNLSDKMNLLKRGRDSIARKDGDVFSIVPLSAIKTRDEELSLLQPTADEWYQGNRKLRDAFMDIMSQALEPNLFFDTETTEKMREKAYRDAQPVYDRVLRGENIIRRGQLITSDDISRLREIEKLRAKKEITRFVSGLGVIVGMILGLFFIALFLFERAAFADLKQLFVICVIVALVFLISKLFLALPLTAAFIPPTVLAPVLVAILFTQRIGLIVVIIETLFVGVITQFNPLYFMAGLGGGIIALYPTIGLRKRAQYFRIGFYVGVSNAVFTIGYSLLKGLALAEFGRAGMYALLNGFLIMPFFLFIGIWLFEHLFNITTDISLLELSDLNHPLLRRLVIEAPGTYHHSLVVSNLAENACESIGANSLLARVGCYYHDIGKIEKAEYFTENQASKDQNIHDKLSPSMSCMFIVNHVHDGLTLGRKYKLRDIILDFIAQHHGKSVIYYFYKKALDQKEHEELVPVDEFRYPGPKPQTKEIAVAMLADSVEAASRTLSPATPDSIVALVNKVINDKFMDNQMDECDLTLNDLRLIQSSFVRNLMAIFHTRIEYPEINTNGQIR